VRQLADWGADCIKIELPNDSEVKEGIVSDRNSPDFQNLHRNKRSMTLNLKTEKGKEIFFKLASEADVIVENYRPDVKNRLGIDYNTLKLVNSRIILGSISGFGQDGPYHSRPGVDQIAQGMGGLMSITGKPGQGPLRAGTAIADLSAGLYCAIGILIALLEREASGEGQWVHTSLLEAQISMLDFQAARWLIGGEIPPPAGNDHPTSIPTSVYPSKDGHLNIAAGGQVMFERLARALGAEKLLHNHHYSTDEKRSANRDLLNKEIAKYTIRLSTDELVEKLNNFGVPAGPIYTIDKMFEDRQVKHLGLAAPVESPKHGSMQVVGQAVNLSRANRKIRSAAPELGQHTEQILNSLGYDSSQIEKLRLDKVI
tara:strand:+ start:88 stop:1200 length:1113 start_codon:yes stop_codon:yes gene_type:complete